MRHITRSILATGNNYCLSPEKWLSTDTSTRLSKGILLGELIKVIKQTAIPPEDATFVLDTSHAREGLLDLPILGDPASGRTSAKKLAREGDVIFSRLRPYLRQVALLPKGISELLGQEEFYCSTEFFIFRGLKVKNIAGLIGWFLSDPIQEMVSEATTGGHHPRIHVDLLLNSPVPEHFLDADFSTTIASVLASHIAGQRKLNILLRH